MDTEWKKNWTQRTTKAQGVEDTLRGRCWPVCNQTGGSEAVGTHYVLHTHIPETFFFFLPLSCQPSKRNELTPPFWDFPSFTQTTQTDASHTCQLVWVAGRGSAGSPSGVFGKVRWHRARSQRRASLQRLWTEDLIKFILAIMQWGLQR